jgi:pimeloyl-ACP methyl ester carboxylesterase
VAQARGLVALLDQLVLGSVVLVGYDVGSGVALALARSYPERVRALVLGAPSYPGMGNRRLEAAAQRELWYQHFHSRPTVEAREVRCPRPASAPRIGSSQVTVRLRSIDNYPFSTTSDRSTVCGTPG